MIAPNAQRPPFLPQVPIGRALVDPLSADALDRMWANVAPRLPRRAPGARRRRDRARHWVLVAVALGALVVFAFWHASKPQPAADLLLLADGSQFDRVAASAGAETRRFTDGSSLRVEAGEVVSLASTSREFVVLLERGRAHFHVVPGGPRRWIVELGLGRVEVVGTEFSVERQLDRAVIAVSHGKVLVRSTLLEDAVKAVGSGERVVLSTAERDTGEELRAAPSAGVELRPQHAAGRGGSTGGSLPPEPAAVDVVAALLHDADLARLERDFDRAARILERVVKEHPSDSRAALASYGHGVLAFRQLGRPEHAVLSFQRALALGAPRSLREDCYLAWVEVELGRGDRARANELFTRYLDEFPTGRHRLEMQRLLGIGSASSE